MSGATRGLLTGLAACAVLAVQAAAAQEASGPPRYLSADDASPAAWPVVRRPTRGSPSVLLVLTDHVGFGASSTFGGPVPTPNLDALAARGLRYTQFHTTALCSPTRGALLTGRNPNRINLGNVTNLSTGFDGFTSVMPKSAATVAALLRDAGYATAMFGKSHVTPEWEQSRIGPFDRWPTGLGFDYFYGFLNADTSQWEPSLVENTTFLEPRYGERGYFLEQDLADRAIRWMRDLEAHDPSRPFFVYYAPGTAHAPHHAPREWIARFRGKFDAGWDAAREATFARQRAAGVVPSHAALTPRPDAIPAWSSLDADQRRAAARYMEAFAAAVACLDAQVGRLLQEIDRRGGRDDTLVIFIQGDNGGSAEGGLEGTLYEQSAIDLAREPREYVMAHLGEMGGPTLYNNYPAGWAWAMSTPFQWYKQVASHFGGIRNGMVLSWPARVPQDGSIRPQFHFVTDIAPTILAAAGIDTPRTFAGVEQMPMDGVDISYSFRDPAAPSRRTTQAFSMMQHLGLYHEGWWIGTQPLGMPWQASHRRGAQPGANRTWELYNVDEDFSQARDLATAMPGKLEEMQALFWAEAERNRMLPIHSSYGPAQAGRPSLGAGRRIFEYLADTSQVVQDAAPPTVGRAFRITADLELASGSASGVVLAQGGRFSGYSLYLRDGRPVFHYNALPFRRSEVASAAPLPQGRHRLVFRFLPDAAEPGSGGTGTLEVDGTVVAEGRIARTLSRWISHTEGLDVGADRISPVATDYRSPAVLEGTLDRVVVELD
jgi:arylsulfatase